MSDKNTTERVKEARSAWEGIRDEVCHERLIDSWVILLEAQQAELEMVRKNRDRLLMHNAELVCTADDLAKKIATLENRLANREAKKMRWQKLRHERDMARAEVGNLSRLVDLLSQRSQKNLCETY